MAWSRLACGETNDNMTGMKRASVDKGLLQALVAIAFTFSVFTLGLNFFINPPSLGNPELPPELPLISPTANPETGTVDPPMNQAMNKALIEQERNRLRMRMNVAEATLKQPVNVPLIHPEVVIPKSAKGLDAIPWGPEEKKVLETLAKSLELTEYEANQAVKIVTEANEKLVVAVEKMKKGTLSLDALEEVSEQIEDEIGRRILDTLPPDKVDPWMDGYFGT